MPKGVYKKTAEHGRKISLGRRGIRPSLETRKKMRKAQLGRKHPKEVKEKISKALTGRKRPPFSDEWRNNIGKAHRGIKQTKAARKQRSKTLMGRKRPAFSDEWKNKMSISRKGEKNHNWRGGITPLTESIRHCREYRVWHKYCTQRDKKICQVCGKHGGKLHVDHYPKPFSKIFHDNKISSLEEALACKDFWDATNGRTLCKKCHEKTDTFAGRVNKFL